jgi:hypothetical protein
MDTSTADSSDDSRFPRPVRSRHRRAVAGAALLLLLAGCAGGPRPRPPGAPGGGAGSASDGAEPWQIPRSAYGLQRLYRVSFTSPEGEGSFRLTLRLTGPDRYQASAVDPVGRTLWSLDVAGDRGLFLDHRNRLFCRFEGGFDISGVPLSPFPLLSLPALLLGRVPAEPASDVRRDGERVSFEDDRERRWDATVRAGALSGWILRDEQGPAAYLTRQDGWAILSDRRQGVQVRWREILREELRGEPEPLAEPAGYREECAPADPAQG